MIKEAHSIEYTKNFEKEKESQYAIIAPDDPSGRAFESKFKAQGLDLAYQEVSIRPRVVENTRSTNPGVYADLLDAIRKEWQKGHTKVIIACNTLQFWAQDLEQHRELYEDMPGLEIFSSFKIAKEAFPERDKRPLWLGTSVTSTLLNPTDFDTPTNKGLDEIQEHVQEIIWRTKASSEKPVDYSGANKDIENITDPNMLILKTKELVKELKDHNIKEVFLGCTELPIAFEKLDKNDLEGLNVIDIADIMASKVKANT